MLSTRLIFGISMAGSLALILYLDEFLLPWYPVWFILSLSSLAAASFELVGLLGETPCRPSTNSVMGGIMAVVVANWVPHINDYFARTERLSGLTYQPTEPIAVLSWPLFSFVGVLMVTFVVQGIQFERPGRTMATIAGTLFVVAYIGLLGSFIIQMRWLEGRLHGIIPLAALVATAKGADTGAYTFGRLFGRTKLWPALSPNKTVEGAVGGMVFAVLFSLLVTAIARFVLATEGFDWLPAMGFGLLIGLVAQIGDLMESMIKRDCERKDASTAVPGFGGVLDVLDSLLFAGPLAYGYWIWWGP